MEVVAAPDTHAHLDASVFAEDLDSVLVRAHEAGVRRILAVGSDLPTSLTAVGLADRYEEVYAAVGIHPHEAHRFSEEADGVRDLLSREKVVAVGEIGLDYGRHPVSAGVQLIAFREQARWAREHDLPVSVHNRSADKDIIQVTRELDIISVLHCFSGTWDFAVSALAARAYLSFAGNLTYRNADTLRAVARQVPLDRVLVETDSPVLPPQPWRGKRNEPAYVTATLRTLASERGLPVHELANHVSRNAQEIFSWGAA